MNFHNAVVADPSTYNRQAFLLFAICVAGKKADVTAQKLREVMAYLAQIRPGSLPFDTIKYISDIALLARLKAVKTGRYGTLTKAFRQCAESIDVDNTSLYQLLAITGIGHKTARYFMVYAHGAEHAIIDTHITKFLNICGVYSKNYATLEAEYLRRCRAIDTSARCLDNIIWQYFARNEMKNEFLHVTTHLFHKQLAPFVPSHTELV